MRLVEKEMTGPTACWYRDERLLVVFGMKPNQSLFKNHERQLQTEKVYGISTLFSIVAILKLAL